jgi:uncharacterized membrane protein YgdD (TMEM256/DUF423 family)
MRTSGVILALAGLSGAAGMALAAMVAHLTMPGGNATEAGQFVAVALRYHLLHAVALLALGGLAAATAGRWSRAWPWVIAVCWVGGTLFFSGGLYLRVFAGITSLGWIVPVGGSLYILGWVVVAVAGLAVALKPGRA